MLHNYNCQIYSHPLVLTRHVYWVDTYLDYIERCDYDGNNRKTVVRGAPVENLYGLAVFQNKLFVTSWRENAILAMNKFQPNNHST